MGVLKGKTIAMLGLSFKPNTDDIREAPSLSIIRKLMNEKAYIRAYDPVSMKETQKVIPAIKYCKDSYDAVKGAHALVIMTEWNQFRNLDLDRIRKLLKEPYFFDLRNIYEPRKLMERGFKYFCVGRT
jgi:UDPglucose 6-dehydrogenase